MKTKILACKWKVKGDSGASRKHIKWNLIRTNCAHRIQYLWEWYEPGKRWQWGNTVDWIDILTGNRMMKLTAIDSSGKRECQGR
jgi:hypothetical protein